MSTPAEALIAAIKAERRASTALAEADPASTREIVAAATALGKARSATDAVVEALGGQHG